MVAALTLVAYLACSLRDPGYVPRVGREPLREALLEHQPRCRFCACAAAAARQALRHDCHRCVRRLDHHCFWLGNCVGARTHRTFLLYLVLQNALLWWTCAAAAAGAFALAYASPPEPAAAGAAHVGRVLAACACALLCLLMGLAALVLLAFQRALIVRGETTWEHLRRDTLNAAAGLPPLVRPFDRGAARNSPRLRRLHRAAARADRRRAARRAGRGVARLAAHRRAGDRAARLPAVRSLATEGAATR